MVLKFFTESRLAVFQSSHLLYTSHISSLCQLESSSTMSSFPDDSAKPVPLAVVSWIVGRDNGNLVHPFICISNYMMRLLAILRESSLLPPVTCPSLNFFTMTFSALSRNHIRSTPDAGLPDALF